MINVNVFICSIFYLSILICDCIIGIFPDCQEIHLSEYLVLKLLCEFDHKCSIFPLFVSFKHDYVTIAVCVLDTFAAAILSYFWLYPYKYQVRCFTNIPIVLEYYSRRYGLTYTYNCLWLQQGYIQTSILSMNVC